MNRTVCNLALVCSSVGLGLAGLRFAAPAQAESRPAAVQIGMVNSLFLNTPDNLLSAMMQPFQALMESQTGVPGKIQPGGDVFQLAEALNNNKVQLGVFHGVEFGWAKEKYPELRPLMIAVNENRNLRAWILVRDGSNIQSLADLTGKALGMSKHTRHHCHLFLERRCEELGHKPEQFFGRIVTLRNSEVAIEALLSDSVQAVLIDDLSGNCYKRYKPAQFATLKLLETSPTFPAGVVAYRPGALDEATLRRFREGMLNANKNTMGRQMMTMWRLTAFEKIPADFDASLASIIKAYPAAKRPAEDRGTPITTESAKKSPGARD
jgi:ABC-type phosphate/phosphonate transport system substrate-binding protein